MTRIWLDWIGISSPRVDHWKTSLIKVVFFILFYFPCVYSLNTNFVVPFFWKLSMVINLCCVRKINRNSHVYLLISCKTLLLYVLCIGNCYFFM